MQRASQEEPMVLWCTADLSSPLLVCLLRLVAVTCTSLSAAFALPGFVC